VTACEERVIKHPSEMMAPCVRPARFVVRWWGADRTVCGYHRTILVRNGATDARPLGDPRDADREPRTEASRRLVEEWFPGGGDGLDVEELAGFRRDLAAIEEEAAALDVDRLARALRAENVVSGVAQRYGRFSDAYYEALAQRLGSPARDRVGTEGAGG
jgi:hypothetical protein